MEDEQLRAIMGQLSHQWIHEVWEQAKDDEPFDDPEKARYARVMKDHPQYYRYWEKALKYRGRDVTDKRGANPFAHITLEAILEAQLEMEDLPEVNEALEFPVENGVEEHEARHSILRILSEEIWLVLHEKRTFDEEGYKRKLKDLMRQD